VRYDESEHHKHDNQDNSSAEAAFDDHAIAFVLIQIFAVGHSILLCPGADLLEPRL
jgi:hypothetical protein